MRGRLRERQPNVWEVSVELGRDPVTGRRKQLSKTVRGGKREAEAVLNQVLADVGRGVHLGTDARVKDLLARWLDHCERELSPTTVRRYRGLIKLHIEPAMGDRSLHKVRVAELDAFYLGLVRQKNLEPATVRQVHAVLRRAMTQAVRWGWIATNPAANASPPRVRRREIQPPTPAQVMQIIQAADRTDAELGCFLRLTAATGARRGEVCALRWKHFDLDAGSVTIGRAIIEVPGGLLEKDTKTHSVRRIALDDGTIELLRAHRERMDERASVAEAPYTAESFLFSLDPDGGRPWSPDRVTKLFVALRRQLGFDGLRLHDLRHFAATRLLAAGVPVRTVAGRLGHANAATTLSVYAHFLEASDATAAVVMGALLTPPTGNAAAEAS